MTDAAMRRLYKWFMKCRVKAATDTANRIYCKEKSTLPIDHVGRVRIHGCRAFAAEVRQALQQLQSNYPHGFSLVQRYIAAIVQRDIDPEKGTAIGVIYRKANPDGSLGVPVSWFAAALVRRAVATRKLLRFDIWRSRRSALGSLKKELHAMRLLQCDPEYFYRQNNKILQLERELRETGVLRPSSH
jgi:hypothetical protein